MSIDILTFGEALVEVMRTDLDQPLDEAALFTGPYASGAPFIFTVQAARLGVKAAGIGTVGDDAFGRCILRQLEIDGVDTRGVQISPSHTTGVAFVAYSSNGSRDFVFHIAHAAAGLIAPSMLPPELFDGLRVLHVMGSSLSIHPQALETGLRAVQMAQEAGAKISFDPNLRPQLLPIELARSTFEPIMYAADVILPTAEEACLLTGTDTVEAAAAVLLAQRPERILVITKGAAGCTVYTSEQAVDVPGFTVEQVDPTGAGDCFDAGFLVRWLAGDTPQQAARFANACGALAVTKQGPMSGAHTLDAVNNFIRSQYPTRLLPRGYR